MRSAIAEIRERVAQLREALLTPGVDALDGCIPVLEEAVTRLKEVSACPLDARDRAEVSLLKHDLVRVQGMTASGLAFRQGWARVVGAAAAEGGGYTASGASRDAARRSNLEVKG